MSTHKHIDKICCVAVIISLLITVIFMNGESFGIQASAKVMGYENRLFDTSTVHTIDIIMDDWDSFLETCQSEEYSACTVVIDGESYKNVGIRGKGNTSLSTVSSMDSERYSFKVEFDQYDSTKSYHGLDKLSLNNIIQDNTYMKDYLVYQMMNSFGVDAPLCSYVYITVNGEDWGLYLAVEGVENSFLQRNYGNDYGELYKPDSMSFGGGRGNGMDFDINELDFENMDFGDFSDFDFSNFDFGNFDFGNFESEDSESESTEKAESQITNEEISDTLNPSAETQADDFNPSSGMQAGDFDPSSETQADNFNPSSGMQAGDFDLSSMTDETGNMQIPEGMALPEDFDPSSMTDETGSMQIPEGMALPEDFDPASMTDETGSIQIPEGMALPEDFDPASMRGGRDFGGGMGGMGSSDVKLQYIDDDPSSYSNIFNNAKTDITEADQQRLIESLKSLSSYENIEDVVNIEEVIRYFVVHNFVVNDDSYTGMMIHNYYLYEEDGQLSMIPWDYNLAFGTFQSSNATSTVNDPIDYSAGSMDDRPMLGWIFESEEYTELYHQYFSEFISEYFDSGYFTEMIDSVIEMIAPYVEKDPTKFCTYEEFETGIETLRQFCLLRAESINGQLDGNIPSTSEEQNSADSTLVAASSITISDMGTMSMGGGGFGGGNMNRGGFAGGNMNRGSFTGGNMQMPEGFDPSSMINNTPEDGSTASENAAESSSAEENVETSEPSSQMEDATGQSNRPQAPEMAGFGFAAQEGINTSDLIILGVSTVILLFGLIFAFKYRRQ